MRTLTFAIWGLALGLALAPIIAAALAEPRITVLTADQFARTW